MTLSVLDLKIELSPSQLSKIDSWLNNFYSKCKSRMSDPVVEEGFLKISSVDIYNFLSVIDVDEGSTPKTGAVDLIILEFPWQL